MAGPRIWFDPPTFSWGRVVRIGLLWLALVLAFILPLRAPDLEPMTQASGTAPQRVARAASVAPATARLPAPRSSPVAAPVRVASASATRSLPVCARVGAEEVAKLRERVLVAIRNRGGEWPEAVALSLETSVAARGASETCEGAGCSAQEALRTSATRRVDSLALMAVGSGDARVYMLALNACASRQAAPAACQSLSPERWAQLDPTNAAPWFAMAARAQQAKDAPALSEAMQGAARATYSDTGWAQLPALVVANAPSDDAAVPAALQLAAEVAGGQSAALQSAPLVMDYCRDEVLREPHRRQICSDIAELLATRSATLTDRTTGATIGRRLGWPQERSETLRVERDAVAQFNQAGNADAIGCDGMRRTLAHVREVGQFGEFAAAQRAIANSGKTLSAWAEENRVATHRADAAARGASGALASR